MKVTKRDQDHYLLLNNRLWAGKGVSRGDESQARVSFYKQEPIRKV
jgi:hypothetical protein